MQGLTHVLPRLSGSLTPHLCTLSALFHRSIFLQQHADPCPKSMLALETLSRATGAQVRREWTKNDKRQKWNENKDHRGEDSCAQNYVRWSLLNSWGRSLPNARIVVDLIPLMIKDFLKKYKEYKVQIQIVRMMEEILI